VTLGPFANGPWLNWTLVVSMAMAGSVGLAACGSDDDDEGVRQDGTPTQVATADETPTQTPTVEAPTEVASGGAEAYLSSLDDVVQEGRANFPDCDSLLEAYRGGWEGIGDFEHCPRALVQLIAGVQTLDPPTQCQALQEELILRAAALASRDDFSVSDVFLQPGRSQAWATAASQCGLPVA
jgi:hypothetical protein